MNEAGGLERACAFVDENLYAGRWRADFADVCDVSAVEFVREAGDALRADGEEKFKIFAAVEGVCECIGGVDVGLRNERINREIRGIDKRADVALLPEAPEVGGEAAFAEQRAPSETRFGLELAADELSACDVEL